MEHRPGSYSAPLLFSQDLSSVLETNTSSPNLPDQPWMRISSALKQIIDSSTFKTFIEHLKTQQKSDEELVLVMPNKVFYRSFMGRFQNLLENLKEQLDLQSMLITYDIEEEDRYQSKDTETLGLQNLRSDADEDWTDGEISETSSSGESASRSLRSHPSRFEDSYESALNPNYTFDTFVKGQSNQFAHATCQAVADGPGCTYNPLFIYGSTGLGKTHLLHAVGWQILKSDPKAKICYISSERFMNDMIYAIRFGKTLDFRKKYRNCDVFLVDDIQFISKKTQTQEEFFHTFNTLYEAKKQIVMTSDKFPQDIPDIEERLRNRFQWGLIADIQHPDVEHRVAILLTKAESLGITLSEDVALYIASHAKKNVRELEGALHRLQAFSALQGRPMDLTMAMQTFQHVLGDGPRTVTIEVIQKIVAEYFRIRVSDLRSKKRHRAVSLPRQIAMYVVRQKTNASFPEIGQKFGGKDHTTVIHAVNKITQEIEGDMDLRTQIEAIERRLEQQ